MKYIVTINNKNYEVEVEKGQANIVKTTETAVQIAQVVPQAATSVAEAATTAPQATPAAAPVGTGADVMKGEKIAAPMTGTILNVKVNVGDKIKKGDVLFILEAMKMENEIVAPVDGVVIQIIGAKSSTVSTGDILAVIQ